MCLRISHVLVDFRFHSQKASTLLNTTSTAKRRHSMPTIVRTGFAWSLDELTPSEGKQQPRWCHAPGAPASHRSLPPGHRAFGDDWHLQLVNRHLHRLFNPRLYEIRVTGRQRAQLATDGNVSAVERLLANKVLDVKRLYYRKIDGYYETADRLRHSVQEMGMAMCRALIAAGARCANTVINPRALELQFARLLKDPDAFVQNVPAPSGREKMCGPKDMLWHVSTVSKALYYSEKDKALCLWFRRCRGRRWAVVERASRCRGAVCGRGAEEAGCRRERHENPSVFEQHSHTAS
ncbi:hypothetical protein FN846DRAFT_886207 [Sphaerosporella brunnea]|uniref:Uncharacterized protein n=1 Tax=Sphaerosporella brunnea TaxID=1250544 RepID=A0A5J5F9M0_9PEZI|nr:hypothetical protein FN846DRAFT_886207 [Sphaerosporella brunnea]